MLIDLVRMAETPKTTQSCKPARGLQPLKTYNEWRLYHKYIFQKTTANQDEPQMNGS
jgi:hypothetical protein